MKWFDKKEFEKLKKLIDDGAGAKAIGDWYWEDFKNNATTTTMGYFYAKMNGKCAKCTTKLENLLKPKGKTGPLEFNDVVTEMWNHDPIKAIKNINILLDNEIPFQIKSGDVAYEFMENPQLAGAMDKNPNLISKYMKRDEKIKINRQLLKSNDYELVKQGILGDIDYAKNNKVRAYKKTAISGVLRSLAKISNADFVVRIIKEELFTNESVTAENLFSDMYDVYKETGMSDNQLVDIFSSLNYSHSGNGGATDLLYGLYKDGKTDVAKKIIEVFDGNLFGSVMMDIRQRPHKGGEKLYGPERELEWILDGFSDIIEPDDWFVDVVAKHGSEEAISMFFDKYPDNVSYFGEKYPDKMPQAIKDMFIF